MAGKALLRQGEKRRKAIVRFIIKYRKSHDYGPTITEVATAVGLGSANATRHHLLKLRDEGVISMEPKIARSISVIQKPAESVETPAPAKKPARRPAKPKAEPLAQAS